MKFLTAASFIAALLARSVAGQPALTRNEVTRADTCLGAVEITSVPADPSHDVILAVFADTLLNDDLTRAGREISSLYQALRPPTSLRLALLKGNDIQFAGPFRTRAALQAALADLTVGTPATDPAAASPLRPYTILGAAAPQLGSKWSTVVLVGKFPAVPPPLASYAAGWLSMRLRAAKLQVSYWAPSDQPSDVLNAAIAPLLGTRLDHGLAPVARVLQGKDDFREVSWHEPALPAGFRGCSISLIGGDGDTVVQVPTVVEANGVMAPDLESYAVMRDKIQALTAALRQPQLSPEQIAQAEADLTRALAISPREEEALRLGAELFRRARNDPKLAATLSALVEIAPTEASLFVELGSVRYRLADWDGADRALLRARQLKPGDAGIAEKLARIRVNRKDDPGALPYLEESLNAHASNQELWLLRADISARLNDWQRTADSLEHALALGSVPLERRTALIRLDIEHQLTDRALIQARAVAEHLPQDAAVRAEYAGFFETMHRPEEALAAWKRVFEVDPKMEPAYEHQTQLLIEIGRLPEALQSAEAGIQAAPQAAPLYLAKSEVLEKQNQYYEARRTLRAAAPRLSDPALLARLAEMEDAGGEHAARYYRELAEARTKNEAAPDSNQILQRGLDAALRDGDLDEAQWFRTRLTAGSAAGSPSRGRSGAISIPGGIAALSFIAESRQSTPDRFLVEYARTVARFLGAPNKKVGEAYAEKIHEHFRLVSQLAALGTSKGGMVTITIAAQDKRNQKNAEKILDLLGWKMHASKQGVKLEAAEKGARVGHQETASALALNEVGMQEDLEAGKPFSFQIPSESAGVVLGEDAWRSQFYAKEKYPGGLAEAIAGDLRLAQTYAALGQMDAGTAEGLVAAIGLRNLADKYAALLLQHSSALAIEQGRVAVPGGVAADAIWTRLAGANPLQPANFFRALLARDDGKLLAYYAALGALDIQHQRFFTRTTSRTAKFYQLFKDAPEMQHATSRHIPSGSFVEFLSEVPLNDDGSVDFPGSAEVWTVAKGQSHSTGNVAKLMKKLKRAVAPDVEDEILLRLASTRYKQGSTERGELDNFLAVVRIDEHRSDPLDEESALMLAQHFAEYGAAYPFFATLTGLGQKQFEQFFALSDSLRGLSEEARGSYVAPVSSLIEILCLAQQAGTLDEKQSADLFGRVVETFQHAAGPAAWTAASLELVRAILARAPKGAPADPDQAMQTLLLSAAAPATIDLDGNPIQVDPSKARHAAYQQVLDLQKVPSLDTVLALSDAVRDVAAGKRTAAAGIRVLESRAAGLNYVEASKDLGLKGKTREQVEGFQPRRLQELVKQFRDKTSRKTVNPKDLKKLSQDYLEAIDVPVRWALEGVVYAYFLSPDDLLVSEDPLLLRKHQFVTVAPQRKNVVWQSAELEQSSDKQGSYFTGGFADFADAAGFGAAKSAKLGSGVGESAAAKQIAALRLTDWFELRNDDLRLMDLKVTVAREWVVRASRQPELAAALSESALGLLSLTRRADLMNAIADGNWTSVWRLLTLSDLYFLGDRYLARYKTDAWQSPATRGLRHLLTHGDGSRLQMLGGEFADTLGCSHPHLHVAPPYEEYQSDLFPARLAERDAEFKLYLARYADQQGIPAAALGAVAEPAARVILKRMQVTDLHDWRSVLAAYASLDNILIEGVLAKQ